MGWSVGGLVALAICGPQTPNPVPCSEPGAGLAVAAPTQGLGDLSIDHSPQHQAGWLCLGTWHLEGWAR